MTLKISDQGIFQISKVLYTQFLSEKRLKQLDHDRLDQFKKLYIKPLYPHKQTMVNGVKNIEKYQCDQYCCEVDPGRFCCCSSKPPDPSYREFGMGLCLYIKFLKHLSWFLFFIALLSIVAIAMYEIVALQTGYDITGSYHNTLFSTTIGTLSSQFLKCNYANIQTNSAEFKLSCKSGQVSYLQPVFTNQTKPDLLNCRKQSIKMNQKIYMPSYTLTSITNSSLSQYAINVSIASDVYQDHTYKFMAFNYQCANPRYQLAGRVLPSQAIIFITIGIDLFIIFCFICFLVSEHKAEDEEITYFKMKELAVNDFTLKVGGFRLGREEQDLDIFLNQAEKLRRRIDPNWQKNGNSIFNNVVQVKIPEIDQIKEALELRRQYYQEMYDLIDLCFFEDGIDLYRYKDANDFIKKCYGTSSSPQYLEYRKRLQKLLDQFLSSKKVKFIDHDIEFSLLIAFTNPRDKKLMLKYSERNCFGPFVRAPNRKFYLSEPPIADMIIWQNKNKFTCLRVIIAWIITLAICFGSYLLVAFATFQKQVLLKNNKFNVGCDLFYTSQQLSTFQQSLSDINKQTYLHCYCNYNYFSFDYKDVNMRSTCSQWFSDFIVYSAIPILISFGIIFYNIIVDRIFRFLSKFESHDYLSTELYSYIIKRSFMLIMNMGLIIILIKLNYNYQLNVENLTFLFQGTYKDLTSDWYLEIGVIIILTLAFNIVIPIADMIFVSFVKCIRKCIDRRCYCVKTSQKSKKGYLELYLNDVFPIESRYSDFIAMIIIIMSFSAVMPILYIIGFLSIWFMFMCDKLLLFRVYQKPINYSQDLQTKVFRIAYIAIMIHCVVSPFVLSEKYLMSAGANIQKNSRFQVIISTSYLIPYVAIFVLLAAWAIFHSTFVRAVSYCVEKCTKDNSKLYRSKLEQNFFEALNKYQINRLKMSLQLQLNSSIEHQKSKASQPLIKKICQNSLKKLQQADRALNVQNNRGPNNIKMIGKAGYDEIFDDEIFNRDKKIKSLDYQFQDIFRAQRMMKKGNNVQNTVVELNF